MEFMSELLKLLMEIDNLEDKRKEVILSEEESKLFDEAAESLKKLTNYWIYNTDEATEQSEETLFSKIRFIQGTIMALAASLEHENPQPPPKDKL